MRKQFSERGQTLLFVVVTMTVALAVGIGLSLRTLSSISRVSTTDTATRVQGASEGGVERFLTLSLSELDKAKHGNCPSDAPANLDGECVVTFAPTTGDNITAIAKVKVEEFGATSSGSYFKTSIDKGLVTEINLEGYGGSEVRVCWAVQSGTNGSDIYLLGYGDSEITKEGVESGTSKSGLYTQGGFDSRSPGMDGFSDCYKFSLPSDPLGLRIQPMNETIDVGVYPMGDNLPLQGYKIISVGQLLESDRVTATESIEVFRSLPFLPHVFNYGVYSETGTID